MTKKWRWACWSLVVPWMWLPTRLQWLLGGWIGALCYLLLWRRRAIAARNLVLCFPRRSDAWRRALLWSHFQDLGRSFFETTGAIWHSPERLQAATTVSGAEHLHQALEGGHGAILIIGHFTTMLPLCGVMRLFFKTLRFCILHMPFQGALGRDYQVRHGRHFGATLLHHYQIRQAMRALRNNAVLIYAPDQALRHARQSVVPFFGVPTWSSTTAARLARASKAAVLPVALYRCARNRYGIAIGAPLKDFPGADMEAATLRLNHLLEKQIERFPSQYFWLHRRFKRSPDGRQMY